MSDDDTFIARYPDGRRVRLRWPMRKEMAKQLDDQEYSIETGASYPRTLFLRCSRTSTMRTSATTMMMMMTMSRNRPIIMPA